MNPHTFIFIGRSGCGKGTQAKLIIEYLTEHSPEIPALYLETGARFRDFIAQDNYSSKRSKKIMEAGGLQPIFLAIHMWSHLFIENITGGEHLIIDGTPRKLVEAHALDSALKFYERGMVHVVYMNVSPRWATERLLARGRADDKRLEDIKNRMDWFEAEVMPTVEYYRGHPDYHFLEINGERTIEEIQAEIRAKVG